MPRKKLIRSSTLPYHVTARCNNRDPFFLSVPTVWRILLQELREVHDRYGCHVHAFVLMPNHFHLMISTPNEDLGIIMKFFMQSITKKINSKSRRIGRVFGARYHWSMIDNDHYLDCAFKYIYRNPVKAQLSPKVESYPYSSLRSLLEGAESMIPLSPVHGFQSLFPSDDVEGFVEWLNQPFPREEDEMIRKGFKKTIFSLRRENWKRANPELEQFQK